VLPEPQYETAPRGRRWVADALAATDAILRHHPRIAPLGGTCVVHGTVR